ncbi:MAG: hypothetical protein Q9180_009592, partial [Flavoplaca navasiana]
LKDRAQLMTCNLKRVRLSIRFQDIDETSEVFARKTSADLEDVGKAETALGVDLGGGERDGIGGGALMIEAVELKEGAG